MEKLININLYGGPGTGKSTIAAGLFYNMKIRDYKVEYIQEFAKELVFSEDHTRLKDQLLVLAEQHHRMFRLLGKVDYIIHDSPLNMGQVYLDDDIIPVDKFKDFSDSLFEMYDNVNIFLQRDESNYQEYGRNENLEEAIEKDKEIREILDSREIPYISIKVDSNTIDKILDYLGL